MWHYAMAAWYYNGFEPEHQNDSAHKKSCYCWRLGQAIAGECEGDRNIRNDFPDAGKDYDQWAEALKEGSRVIRQHYIDQYKDDSQDPWNWKGATTECGSCGG